MRCSLADTRIARTNVLASTRRPTNRWTGATGSEFRIIIGPAQLLGNAVARSTQTLCCFPLYEPNRLNSFIGLLLRRFMLYVVS